MRIYFDVCSLQRPLDDQSQLRVMTIQRKPLNEVSHQAIQLLSEQLGVVDTLRFVSQFTTGHGNYTEERDALFGHLTLDDILMAITRQRTGPSASEPVR